MSAAACAAKIKLDSGRAIAGALAFIKQVEDSVAESEKWFDRTLKSKNGIAGDPPSEGELSAQQQKELEALSQLWCKWGDLNFKWGDETFTETSRILVGSAPITYNDTATKP